MKVYYKKEIKMNNNNNNNNNKKNNMPIIYIAGPYRAKHAWAVEQNVQKAENEAFTISSLGAGYICPHLNSRNFNGTHTAEYWLEMTLELMRRCDAVFVLPGWKESEGTLGEIEEAQHLGMPVFFNLTELMGWLDIYNEDNTRPEYIIAEGHKN